MYVKYDRHLVTRSYLYIEKKVGLNALKACSGSNMLRREARIKTPRWNYTVHFYKQYSVKVETVGGNVMLNEYNIFFVEFFF